MPDPCPHTPSVAGACVSCTVQAGMAALVWQAEALPVLRELRAACRAWQQDAVAAAAALVWGTYAEELAALIGRAEEGG